MDFSFSKPSPDLGQEYGKHRLTFFRLLLLANLVCLAVLLVGFDEDGINSTTLSLAALWLLWTLYYLASWYKNRIILHHNGIILRRLLLSDKTFYFQPNMRVFVRKWQYGIVFLSRFATSCTQIRLYTPNGDKLKLSSSWKHPERVLAVLRQYQLIHTLPNLREAYDNGETLDFGGVQLNHAGIWIKRKFYSLQEYTPKIKNGSLYLHKIKANGKSKWRAAAHVSLADICEVEIVLDWIGFQGADLNQYTTEQYKFNPFF